MTIASAFNDIAVAQGGTASQSGTIAGAIDALNDALAGSDQESCQTIEGAVRLLGEHIGGGSSITVEALNVTENDVYTAPEGKAYSPVTVNVSGGGSSDYSIAEVVFTNNATHLFNIIVPNLYEDSMYSSIDSEDIDGETPFDIVLYKGSAIAYIQMNDTSQTQADFSSCTGDIEIYNSTTIYISGDGTATIADHS